MDLPEKDFYCDYTHLSNFTSATYMTDQDLCYTSASELLQMLDRRDISSVELTETILRRIDDLDPEFNGFVTLTPEIALEAALQADKERSAGVDKPLLGIPVTIKDLQMTGGIATQFGSLIRKGRIPDRDAPFVTRLKDSGAVMLGKTTTPEFGWKGVSQSPLTGITSNPWKPGFNAGASSAGAAVGAAAGYGPLHQGSDGAGSIRMPAHFCGVFGLKPSYGRIPNWPVPNNDQASHIGPITRTVADSALMLSVMAGPHHWDHTSLEANPADYVGQLSRKISGLRIAFSPDLGHARVDSEVASLVRKSTAAFESMGCMIDEVTPEFGPLGPDLGRFFWTAHEQILASYLHSEWEEKMDPGLVACIKSGQGTTVEQYVQMRKEKYDYVGQIHQFMEEYDLLITQSVSVAAFPADQLQPDHWEQHAWDWISWAEFSYPFNFSGSPAASVPCGFTDDGLPVGLQLVGKRFDDLGVLQAAAAFEVAQPWEAIRPEFS